MTTGTIPHRWKSEPVFTCEVPADVHAHMRYAIEQAVRVGANLARANLVSARGLPAALASVA